MPTLRLIALLLLAALSPASQAEQNHWPEVVLCKDGLELRMTLPGDDAFYQGSRFDHSPFVYQATIDGFTFFGPWRGDFTRGQLDTVTGTAGEFGIRTALGYEETPPGADFVKIGVGHLRREKDEAYRFNIPYVISNPGEWKHETGDAFVQSTHTLPELRGLGYAYTKRTEIVDGTSFLVTYTLHNTGSQHIATDYYAHNLVVFNNQPVSIGDKVTVLADAASMPEPAVISPREVAFHGPITPGRGYYTELPMPITKPGAEIARVKHAATGASVTLTSTGSPYKIDVYAHDKAICPEPFIQINLAPGETMQWTDTYTLSPPSPAP